MPRTQSRAAKERSDNLIWTRASSSVTVPATSSGSLIDFTSTLETATGENARNWTIERIIGELIFTVPAGTTAGRSYNVYTAIDIIHNEAIGAGNYPEPFSDNITPPWIDGRRVFADHTVPASYASPGVNGIVLLDLRSKRRASGLDQELRMFGYHDNGLSANPTLYYTYSALWRLR